MKLLPSYVTINLIRKALPFFLTYMATLGRKRELVWTTYWNYFQDLLYSSFLIKIRIPVRLPNGSLAVVRPFSQDGTIIQEVFTLKSYDYLEPHQGDIVLDAGAHIGLFTIRASTIVGSSGLIISVEPLPANYDILLQNIGLNSLKNVKPIKTAVGSKEGVAGLYLNENTNTGSASIVFEGKKKIEVPITTIDKLFQRLRLRRLDFMKIDVEGMEYEALEGARNTLEQGKPSIEMEVHRYEDLPKIIKLLREIGYHEKQVEISSSHYIYACCSKDE